MVRSLLAALASAAGGEITDVLLAARGVRLERIISQGQISPEGFWFDQEAAEWVAVLSGAARLAIEGEEEERALGPGDAVYLPAHCRHRVTWTDPAQPTVWLALFVAPSLEPGDGPDGNGAPSSV